MAGKKLAVFVHVDGQAYGPGDDVPAAVAKAISNPDVWAEDDAEAVTEKPKPATRSRKSE